MKKKKLTQKQIKEDIVASLEDCKYTRAEIIEKLIEEDMEDIQRRMSHDFLYNILNDGWKGYSQMTLTELKEEYNDRFEEQI